MRQLLTTLFLILNLIAFSQTNDSITIKGITTEHNLYEEGKRLETVTVNVYEYNTKIISYQTDMKGKFEFNISKNSYTTIEFVKNEFITKRILFDTRTDVEIKNVKPFNIEIVMIENKQGIDYSDLDFPITRVEYIEKYKDFNYVERYTQIMMKKQGKILAKIKKSN